MPQVPLTVKLSPFPGAVDATAVVLVRPSFGHDIDNRASAAPELRGRQARLNFELGEGVRRRAHDKARAVQEVHDVVVS